jgi:hypothetical protein
MNRQCLLVAVVLLIGVIVGAVACQETPEASADSRVSDFLEVGKWYNAAGSDGDWYSFTVSRIINDSWILAHTEYADLWLNVSQLVAIQEEQVQ